MSLSKSKCWYSNNCLHFLKRCLFGFFSEVDTLKSSSLLIYSIKEQSIYTKSGWHKATLINMGEIKNGYNILSSIVHTFLH